MPDGMPIARQFFLVTKKGNFVVDWGNNVYQDIYSSEKMELEENEFTYMAKDSDLMILKQNGVISDFDKNTVYLYPMEDSRFTDR